MEYCFDIGMHVINRSPVSCAWRTSFCSKNCYNKKLYKVFGHVMNPKDVRNDQEWEELTGEKVRKFLKTRKYNARIRLCSRGEAFSSENDIDKINDLLTKNPDTLFWIPTRAWRGPLRERVKGVMSLENARILASIDPSNTQEEIAELISDGWSTMFFGDDHDTDNRLQCPKTWNKEKKACYTCKNGCFSKERVDIHLKKH